MLALTGCSFEGAPVGALDASGAQDAAGDGQGSADAALGAFSGLRRVFEIESVAGAVDLDDPSISASGELFFNAINDVYRAQLNDEGLFVGAARVEMFSGQFKTAPFISENGLTFLVASRSNVNADFDIFVSTRTSEASGWSGLAMVDDVANIVNGPANDTPTFLSRDGLRLYLTSRRTGGQGEEDFYMASRSNIALSFSTVVPLAALNSPREEISLRFTPDELTAYFSTRSAAGDTQIFRARRAALLAPFEPPELVTEINSSGDESDASISGDDTRIVFSADRDVAGEKRIYTATR